MSGLSRSDFWQGCRDCLPLMAGGVPVGLLCGAMAPTAGFSPAEAILMAVAVYSGAAQFLAISIILAGSGVPGLIILGAFLVNAHNLLLGASLAPHLGSLSTPLRLFLAYTLTDGAYALTAGRILATGYSAAYHLGVSAVMFVIWTAANAVGAFAGKYLPAPAAWGLDFTITAVFIALLVPQLKNRTSLVVAVVAALVALVGAALGGGKWYILIACGVAMLTGVLLESHGSAQEAS